MNRLLITLVFTLLSGFVFGQGLPHNLTIEEKLHALQSGYTPPSNSSRAVTTPPPYANLRTMAEWEEIQAIVVSWTSYQGILKQIVAASVDECHVIILTENPTSTQSYLQNSSYGGPVNMSNITIINTALNTIWVRDYGGTTVYANEVDNGFMVDWIYNRPRPDDDISPDDVAAALGLEIYSTTAAPYDFMATGGNFMSDGFGTAFSSNLILDENSGGSTGWGGNFPNHTEAQIDGIMSDFMGIDTYIKMPTLPYDGIHHIDMHMKLLDEETLLVSSYPPGTADGPQIEANIQYVLDNFTTKWGTPFKVHWIPAPPQSGGGYPNQGGYYCTYANAMFVNKTLLVPMYYTQYDTTALRIYEELLPGYNIVGIDCDNSPEAIISASGAIHCIIHEIGVPDPLLISFKSLENTAASPSGYTVQAYIKHRDGISLASIYWRNEGSFSFTPVLMTSIGGGMYSGTIPASAAPGGGAVEYYVQASAYSGKVQRRPITAPIGFKSFTISTDPFGCTDPSACNFNPLATQDDGSCTPPCCPGDINGDGGMNVADLLIILSEFGCSGATCTADINSDGSVTVGDILYFLSIFSAGCP
jgi:agmatine/peptidylarginine deiminase